MVEYVRGVETAEERSRRNYIDNLVNEVHKDHSQFLSRFNYASIYSADRRTGSISAVQDSTVQSLLQQFIQLPGDPSPDEVPTRPPGEILVSFYNHELPLNPESDDESGGIDEGEETQGVPSHTGSANDESQKPTCQPVPLQYLYNFPSNGAEMISEAGLRGLLPGVPGSSTNLGVMYVTSIQFGQNPYISETMC